ncbi:MAG: glycosyl hydrolase family 95 catalytic domain-containing protein [Lachnospiraceae bacterium]
MRKYIERSIALMMTGIMLFGQGITTTAATITSEVHMKQEAVNPYIVYSSTYKDPVYKAPKEEQAWRDGLVTGNGENGLIESESPLNDVLIYQHMKFSFPSNEYHQTPNISGGMEKTKQQLVANERIAANATMINAASQWKKETFGVSSSWHLQNTYSFHPGHQLRMTVTDSEGASDFLRYTNYETAEIGATWTDDNGTQWERVSFSSRADNVTYTYLKPINGEEKINVDLSIDDIADMANEGSSDGSVGDIRYRKIAGADGEYLAQVAHYPDYEHSELINGAFSGVTRIYTSGDSATRKYVFGSAEAVDNHESDRSSNGKVPNETVINIGSDKQPVVRVVNADTLLLVTKSNRTYEMGTMDEFIAMSDGEAVETELVQKLLQETETAYQKHVENGVFSYDSALTEHARLHGEIFNRTKLDLGASEEDRALTTEELLAKQKADKDTMNLALAERAYNNGRYANVCCSGYQVPRLGGMWTGAWHVEWSGDYTTDANINLQVAGSNIGNMRESIEGLLNMELRISSDLLENGYKIYGVENALMAPTRTDGDSAKMIHFGSGFPGHIWNAGMSWLLLPVYEYWQCFGNQNIPLVDDIRRKLEDCQKTREAGTYVPSGTGKDYKVVQDLQEILDLSDERVETILNQGYFDLESDLMRPLLTKQANFWTGIMQPQYYMNKSGIPCYDAEKTSLGEGETYLILPSFSPENRPNDGKGDITINAAMDVSAARDGMNMAIAIEKETNGNQDLIKKWEDTIAKLPEYQYENTGEVKEWMVKSYPENHGHRHISHLYGAWPAHETEYDNELLEGSKMALVMREKAGTDGVAGHSWMHKGLVQARLKNSKGVSKILNGTLSSNVFYTSMMTAHNLGSGGTANTALGLQAYCTDTAITLPAIMLESLVYSSDGVIELLPALPEEWEQGGKVTGVVARTRAVVDSLEWNPDGATATITANEAGTIRLKLGKTWSQALIDDVQQPVSVDTTGDAYITLNLKQGESQTVTFTYSDMPTGYYAIVSGNQAVSIENNSKREGAKVGLSTMNMVPSTARFVTGTSDQAAYDGYVYIKQANANYYVNVDGSQRKDNNGKMIYYNGAVNGTSADKGQFYQFEDAGDGYVRIVPYLYKDGEFADYGHVLGIDQTAGSRTEDGVKIKHVERSTDEAEAAYQLWKIEEYDSFVAFRNKGTQKYMDATSASVTEITQIAQSETGTPSGSQVWYFQSYNGVENSFQITNTATGRMLRDDGTSVVVGRQGTIWKISDGRIVSEDGTKALKQDGDTLSLVAVENGTIFVFSVQEETTISYAADSLSIDGDGVVDGYVSGYEGDTITLVATTDPKAAIRNGVKWIVTDLYGAETDAISVSDGVITLSEGSAGNKYKVYAQVIGDDITSNVITVGSKPSVSQKIPVGKNAFVANYHQGSYADDEKVFATASGSEDRLGIQKNGTVDIKDAYLEFDMSSIDTSRRVKSIELVLTYIQNNTNDDFVLYAADASDVTYAADSTKKWDEAMCWNDIGYLGDDAYTAEAAFASTTVSAGSVGSSFSMDVTAKALEKMEAGEALEMRLYQLVDKRIYVASGRVSTTAYAPCLLVEYYDMDEEETYAAGDVNHSGSVTVEDAQIILQMASSELTEVRIEELEYDTSLADVNDDGKITAVDALSILLMK